MAAAEYSYSHKPATQAGERTDIMIVKITLTDKGIAQTGKVADAELRFGPPLGGDIRDMTPVIIDGRAYRRNDITHAVEILTPTTVVVSQDPDRPLGSIGHTWALYEPDDPLDGLKLIGFSIWKRRGGAGGYNVTFPARSYTVNGDRRSFALLRPMVDTTAQNRVRDLILQAYQDYADQLAPAEEAS